MDLEINDLTNYLIMNREEECLNRIVRNKKTNKRGCGNNRERIKWCETS